MDFCCEFMDYYVYRLDDTGEVCDDENKIVYFLPKFREYGIPIKYRHGEDSLSFIVLTFCPWCGKELPKSMRHEWYDRLWELGIQDIEVEKDKIPVEFRSSLWYENDN